MSHKSFRVALSMRESVDPSCGEVRDAISREMISWLLSFDMDVLLIPNKLASAKLILRNNEIDGLVLSGGNNIGLLKNEASLCRDVSNERDTVEREMIDHAIRRKYPILGICRGMQMLNVYFGGRLVRDIQKSFGADHIATTHDIELNDEASRIFGMKGTMRVNSFHAQGIIQEVLADSLHGMALCGNIIEGVCHETLPIVGVQWHPERTGGSIELDEGIIKAFMGGYGRRI